MPQGIRTKPKKRILFGGLVLFFCLFSHSTYAALLITGTTSPSSGIVFGDNVCWCGSLIMVRGSPAGIKN